MPDFVAIIGAGVSGLTCGVLFAERGYRATILAAEIGEQTTSAVAAAIWYPYDAEPADKVIKWALESYDVFRELTRDSHSGVSMIELRTFSRTGEIAIPLWADSLGARYLVMPSGVKVFKSGFALTVPLVDTTIYLDYLRKRFVAAGGKIQSEIHFAKLEDVKPAFDLIINCAGIGARSLVPDPAVEPHRGQIAIVSKLDLPCAIVSDDPPLMYAIPRANDCVFGGTNELDDNPVPDPAATSRIVAECCRVLSIDEPRVMADRVGLRPFRKSGVRIEGGCLRDGRRVIHNYGHGGSGFTLSWGSAEQVLQFAANSFPIR